MPFDGIPDWEANLQPKQLYCFRSPATEILYGGAAFGGKSHLMRQAAISWCIEIPGLQVYIFRRVEDDLIKNHVEGPTGFRNLLSDKPWAKVLQGEIRFTNGSRIFLCHCKDEEHKYKYHGSEIHVLMIDELTTFTESIYRYLRFRVRMVNINLPAHYRAGYVMPDGTVLEHNVFPRILNGTNPGNIGHHWVKRTFIDVPFATEARRTRQIDGGMIRQYVPARLTDNPRGVEADPTYVNRMRGLGDPALVKAMELGDWNILAGGFFPEFSLEHHVLKAKTLPKEVFSKRFCAVDWGSAKPFSVGWYGIADDDWTTEGTLGNKIIVPRGALVRYREWYGMKPDQQNVGLKLNVGAWAKGVLERTPTDEKIEYVVADTQMWAEDGGPSLAERAMKVKHKGKAMQMRKADKRREPGWDQVRQRLREDPDDPTSASLFLMDNCPEAIRVIQAVQHDELKVEDIDTEQEDHCFVGDTMVRTIRGDMRLSDMVGLDGRVWSHDGRIHNYRSARLIKRDAPVVTLTFNDGSEITCTPDHRFLTKTGWREALSLCGSSLRLCKSFEASGTTDADRTSNARASDCIERSGSTTAAQFLMATTSITRRMIGRAIRLVISNAYQAPGIGHIMGGTAQTNHGSGWSAYAHSPLNGIGAQRVGLGTRSTTRNTLPRRWPVASRLAAATAGLGLKEKLARVSAPTRASRHIAAASDWITRGARALSAAVNSWWASTASRSAARWNAEQSRAHARELVCLNVREAGRADVYCLTVPDTGNFVLANGAIVANCVDEIRYGCMSRPKAKALPRKRVRKGPKEWTMDWLDKMDSTERANLERRRMSVH